MSTFTWVINETNPITVITALGVNMRAYYTLSDVSNYTQIAGTFVQNGSKYILNTMFDTIGSYTIRIADLNGNLVDQYIMIHVSDTEEDRLHSNLDSYTNKDSWKSDVSSLPTIEAKVDAVKDVLDATKLLIDEIDTGMDALDANDVNSIYAKLLEVNADMETLLAATVDVPQQTHALGLGRLV